MTIGFLLVAFAATACVPAPSFPTGPSGPLGPAPVIHDLAVVGPVVAGQPITVQARITHSVGVTDHDWEMKGPGGNGASFPGSYCSDLSETSSGPATDLVVTLTCTLPADAPNGDWYFFLTASAAGSNYANEEAPFEVTDGHSATQLLSQSVEPASIPSGSTFTLTATFTSEHWIYWIWHPAFWDATPPTNPPCDMSDPDSPNNDGTWTFVCDSTGMAPGSYELTARFYPIGEYAPLIVAWDITVT